MVGIRHEQFVPSEGFLRSNSEAEKLNEIIRGLEAISVLLVDIREWIIKVAK